MPEQGLTVFADYACPYCYLAEAGLARLRAGGTSVAVAAYELRPPGTPLPPSAEAWLREDWERVVQPLASQHGMALRYPRHATRTRKAHEAVAYARSAGVVDVMHGAVYRAYWEEGRDIGRIDVLVDVGVEVGLDRGALRVALDIDQWADRVARDEAWAGQLGVHVVPAYLLRPGHAAGLPVLGELRTGLQSYDELGAWVRTDDV
jgi:predicted DsbA family dithiol-disulfide isomerase